MGLEPDKQKIDLQKIGLPRLLVILLAGIVILILSVPQNGTNRTREKQTTSYQSSLQESGQLTELEEYTNRRTKELETILERIEGVGEVNVMITCKKESKTSSWVQETQEDQIQGVVVVASGAGTGDVDAKIIRSVQALFDIESHKISVMKMEQKRQ